MPNTLDALTNVNRISAYTPSVARPADEVADNEFWGEDGFSFDDIIDLLNPLQHLPVVSTLYRSITGDEISSGAQIAGADSFVRRIPGVCPSSPQGCVPRSPGG